jgi:RNA polymerase sigma factor (sigma-70 family)
MMPNVAESIVRSARTYERTVPPRREELETGQNRRWAAWITRTAEGDMGALAALYDESSRPVFSLVHHILQDREAAEETLIGIYLRVRQEGSTFGNQDEIASVWLMTLARNAAVDRLRLASDGRPEVFEQSRRILSFTYPGLTNEQLLIIQMTYLGGFTADEVADMLGLSIENVRQQIVVAMSKLRDRANQSRGLFPRQIG